MPIRDMVVRLVGVAAVAGLGAAGLAMAGTGQPAHAVAGFLFGGPAVFGIGCPAWDATRRMRDRASASDSEGKL